MLLPSEELRLREVKQLPQSHKPASGKARFQNEIRLAGPRVPTLDSQCLLHRLSNYVLPPLTGPSGQALPVSPPPRCSINLWNEQKGSGGDYSDPVLPAPGAVADLELTWKLGRPQPCSCFLHQWGQRKAQRSGPSKAGGDPSLPSLMPTR